MKTYGQINFQLHPSEGYYKVTYNGDKINCCKSIRKTMGRGLKESLDIAEQMVCGNGIEIELTRKELICDWMHIDGSFEFDLIESLKLDWEQLRHSGTCVVIDIDYEELSKRDKYIIETIADLKENLSPRGKKYYKEN